MKKRLPGLKRTASITLAASVAACLALSLYFTSHFHYGTRINGIDVSFRTVEEAIELMRLKTASYTLELEGRDDLRAKLSAADIGLRFESGDKVLRLKEEQKKTPWILSLFFRADNALDDALTYDEAQLKASMKKLVQLDPKNMTDPVDATLSYVAGRGYEVIEARYGNRVRPDILHASMEKAILREEGRLDLEAAGAYVDPSFTSTSQKLREAKAFADRCMQARVTYRHPLGIEVVDGDLIGGWLVISDRLDVSLDEEAMRAYVTRLASHYNTYRTTRTFTGSLGTTATVRGGDYGWRVDVREEAAFLKAAVESGKTLEREPEYLQKAASRGLTDFGDTYLEISITAQHVWYYRDGKLVTHGDIVTGNVQREDDTPTGVYLLKYKKKDATLRGADYVSKVSYWMPFNGDVGFHDAPWRTAFGGSIYLENGSHGCVNAPLSVAKTVFNSITPGTPVVVYR